MDRSHITTDWGSAIGMCLLYLYLYLCLYLYLYLYLHLYMYLYLYFKEREALVFKVESGARCPCGAVMGELGQNKQLPTQWDSDLLLKTGGKN